MHAPLKLHISQAQLHKIRAGHPIQIRFEHIDHPNGIIFQHLHPMNHAKIHKAYRLRKGVRIHITPEEFEGTGFKEWLQKAGHWLKKNAPVLKPIATTILDAGASFYPAYAPARSSFRKLTGVGMHDPSHFVGEPVEHYDGGRRFADRKKKVRAKPKGRGIIPAGYSSF